MKFIALVVIFVVFVSGCIQNTEKNHTIDNGTSLNETSIETNAVNTSNTNAKLIYSENFISGNPLDLSQIESISKFRSCAGHDTPGYNFVGEREYNRSMKHYINPKDPERSKGIKILAPFDGEIYKVFAESHRGSQVYLHSDKSGEWYLVLYHVDLIPGLSEGSKIKTGQIIAYANVGRESDFDIGVETLGAIENFEKFEMLLDKDQEEINGDINAHLPKRNSMFLHMTNDVLLQYSNMGVNIDNIIIAKNFRDGNPCVCDNSGGCYFNTPHTDPANWVLLK